MPLNPILFSQDVNNQFLRYQLTAFPLSDPDLAQQVKEMLTNSETDSQLVKGPYVSLSRPFQEGALLKELVKENIMHPAVEGIADYQRLYAHQEAAYRTIKEGNHCLIATGTGSGKTEAFLYPILDHCLKLRDTNQPPGIAAVIIYPMNALAIDQLERLRGLLAGTGISFGLFIGSTPDTDSDAIDIDQMEQGEGKEDVSKYAAKYPDHQNIKIAPWEERISIEQIRENPPRILLTNINQLEYLLTREQDLKIFNESNLKFLVVDEAHTYTGARGAEVSVLLRRLRTFCNRTSEDVTCIGTSATIIDPSLGAEAGKRFASRFFGIDQDKITVIKEIYTKQQWPQARIKPNRMGKQAPTIFQETLNAIEGEGDTEKIYRIVEKFSNIVIDQQIPWREGLYKALEGNEIIKAIYEILSKPLHISEATIRIWNRLQRNLPEKDDEQELLTYLALGSAAEKEGTPLLRPQLHYFIRGLGGAAGVLEKSSTETKIQINFSPQTALDNNPDVLPNGIFPLVSCTRCGQHYLETYTEVFSDQSGLSGGKAEEDNIYWTRNPDEEGTKLTFTNRFVSESIYEEDYEPSDLTHKLDTKRDEAYICRVCGTIHLKQSDECCNPDCKRKDTLVPIYVLKDHGTIRSCPICGNRANNRRRTSSPLRPLRAVTVADVHILAQEMINSQHVENKKLIVFADNRQEAAFQAAWMADHARRYRLRHIFYNFIENSDTPISIGDLVEKTNTLFKENQELAQALAPEVFMNKIEEVYSTRIEKDMKRYLRIQIIRELVTSFSQRDSLETWGKAKIVYGLDATDPALNELAKTYKIPTKELLAGIEGILDMYRRSNFFYDKLEPIFSQWWHPGTEEVQRGFLPYFPFPPKGLKLAKDPTDNKNCVAGIMSQRGKTSTEDYVEKWGIDKVKSHDFIENLWKLLTETWKIFTPVTLTNARKKPLKNTKGVYQIDSRKIGIIPQHIRFRCTICNRIHTREAPQKACSKIHCKGKTIEEAPPTDDYNISLLSKDFTMLMPEEHTAQISSQNRQYIESEFKKQEGKVNCLVATPTLELGIDIGALDMVLMRNVPPLPANYWQRAGRAGRRHRMAVIYSYATKKPHDEYFFDDPLKILEGTISPPRLNLRNSSMIQKHVHATILSELIYQGYLNPNQTEKEGIQQIIQTSLPKFIGSYLRHENIYQKTAPKLQELEKIIKKYNDEIFERIKSVFTDNWPQDSLQETEEQILTEYQNKTVDELQNQVNLIHKRMMWALKTRDEITDKEKTRKLEDSEEKLLRRCRQYIKDLFKRSLETYTLNILASGGYLPGYAMNQGNISGFASSAYTRSWNRTTFELNRPQALALREYIPGNMIYANGGKYKVVYYHISVEDATWENPVKYLVDTTTMNATEVSEAPDSYQEDLENVSTIPICDAELGFAEHVSDEEQNRFRLPVAITGHLLDEHRGIEHYTVNKLELAHHHNQKVRLLNMGPSDKVTQSELGYPVCRICGATRSPYASEAEINRFKEIHIKTCGREPEVFGFHADAHVDGLLFENLESIEEAINLAEGLRFAAAISLEMETSDLQIILQTASDVEHSVFLYDPMPGGSGIIDQLVDDWGNILEEGIKMLKNCSGGCADACYDCLKSYTNMFYHNILNRFTAIHILEKYIGVLKESAKIPPTVSKDEPEGASTNTPEMRLSSLLSKYGFPSFDRQKVIWINKNMFTNPDFYYESNDGEIRVAIYLDGLSYQIHGNPVKQRNDQLVRAALEATGVGVESIAATSLDDPEMMRYHLMSISKKIQIHINIEDDDF